MDYAWKITRYFDWIYSRSQFYDDEKHTKNGKHVFYRGVIQNQSHQRSDRADRKLLDCVQTKIKPFLRYSYEYVHIECNFNFLLLYIRVMFTFSHEFACTLPSECIEESMFADATPTYVYINPNIIYIARATRYVGVSCCWPNPLAYSSNICKHNFVMNCWGEQTDQHTKKTLSHILHWAQIGSNRLDCRTWSIGLSNIFDDN